MGFGADRRLRERTVMSLAEDVPILIEIVDSDAKIRAFLSGVEGMITEGVLTLQSAHQRVGRHPAAART